MRNARTQVDRRASRAATEGRPEWSGLLPPIALAVATLMASSPVLASAAGNYSNTGIWSGLTNADGFYYGLEAPDPDVGSGVTVITQTRAYLGSDKWIFNGVGYMTVNTQSNRKLMYQTRDASGNWIYTIAGTTYPPYDQGTISNLYAGMWRTSGNYWHLNWNGPGYNTGLDIYNSHGYLDPYETNLGPEGYGGCPSAYAVRGAWGWAYRNKSNGSWYYFPATANFSWGNTPTWFVWGSATWGDVFDYGTVSCP